MVGLPRIRRGRKRVTVEVTTHTSYRADDTMRTMMSLIFLNLNTAVEQAEHARLSRSGPGFDPRSGKLIWVNFFFLGFFLKTCQGPLGPQVPRISFPVIIILSYSPCYNEWVRE